MKRVCSLYFSLRWHWAFGQQSCFWAAFTKCLHWGNDAVAGIPTNLSCRPFRRLSQWINIGERPEEEAASEPEPQRREQEYRGGCSTDPLARGSHWKEKKKYTFTVYKMRTQTVTYTGWAPRSTLITNLSPINWADSLPRDKNVAALWQTVPLIFVGEISARYIRWMPCPRPAANDVCPIRQAQKRPLWDHLTRNGVSPAENPYRIRAAIIIS